MNNANMSSSNVPQLAKERAAGMEAAMKCTRALLAGVGEDPTREGLLDTPKRVAKAMMDLTAGYHQTATGVLGSAYFHEPIVSQGGKGLVVVRDIDFASTSEETLLPFHGRCHVAYIPSNGVVLGLSKLARLTRMFAKRLQSQERMGRELGSALHRQLQCEGVAVILQAKHLQLAGSIQPHEQTTACISGCFTDASSSAFEELLLTLNIDRIPAGNLLQLPVPKSSVVPRCSSTGSDLGVVQGSSNSMEWPIPPATPDLSEHMSEQEQSVQETLSDKSSSAKSDITDSCSDPDSDQELSERGVTDALTNRFHHIILQPPGHTIDDIAVADMRTYSKADNQYVQPEQQPVNHDSYNHDPASKRCGPETKQPMLPALTDPRLVHVDAMELAIMHMLRALGETPSRLGLLGSARRYALTLLQATSGYLMQCPKPLYQSSQQSACYLQPTALLSGIGNSSHDRCSCGGHHFRTRASSSSLQLQSSHQQTAARIGNDWHCCHVRLPFNSQCEHHMLPFYGHISIVYALPPEVGRTRPDVDPSATTSTPGVHAQEGPHSGSGFQAALPAELAAMEQIVCMYTQRLQVQERITHQVADAVHGLLGGNAAVLVSASAAHMCMVARGVENHAGQTTSVATRGFAVSDAAWRVRALQACTC